MSTSQTALQNETLIRADEMDGAGASIRAERTDAQLVELVLAGEEMAFEALFLRHKRLVASVASRYLQRPELIEEVIQTAFAKAFLELRRFRGDHDLSFQSWISRITSNCCLDIIRGQKRRPEGLVDDIDGLDLAQFRDAAYQCVEKKVIGKDLAQKLLSHIEAEDRVLLQMMYAEELGIAEIAIRFGWSASKTKVRAWRARNKLKRILKRYL